MPTSDREITPMHCNACPVSDGAAAEARGFAETDAEMDAEMDAETDAETDEGCMEKSPDVVVLAGMGPTEK